MSADTSKRTSRPVEPSRLLRPQNRLDIILDMDFMTGQADVRSSMILDVTDSQVIAAQTDPPVLKSGADKQVEATIVHHNLVTYESTRWGWNSRIIGINNSYKLNPKDPEAPTVAVIFLSLPPAEGLQKSNVRQAYRIEVNPIDNIGLALTPATADIRLLNFSAGGIMVAAPAPPVYQLGQMLRYNLTFPEDEQYSKSSMAGEAAVVRLEYQPGDKEVKLGLKFQDLNVNASRGLQKIINRYMLEEQRKRNREF